MADCLFCKIVAGEIPATVVLDGNETLAFRDLNPVAPTHVLVIPKRHIEDAATLTVDDDAVLGSMLSAAREVAMIDGIDERGYRLVFNVGKDSGNTVPHLHLHVIGGRAMSWPPG